MKPWYSSPFLRRCPVQASNTTGSTSIQTPSASTSRIGPEAMSSVGGPLDRSSIGIVSRASMVSMFLVYPAGDYFFTGCCLVGKVEGS